MGLWGREQGRYALPPWPKSTSIASIPTLCWCAVANEAGGERTRGLLNRPRALFRLSGSPTTPRGPPVRCRRAPMPQGQTRRRQDAQVSNAPRAARGGEGSQARLSGSLHASGDVGECAGGDHPAVKRGEAASPHEAHGPPQGSRLGEGVTTLKQAYSEECHVRSKT